MSQETRAIALYGDYFRTLNDIENFLEKHGVEDYAESIDKDELGYECLNAFSGDGWVLGIGMELGVPLAHYEALWAKLLPNSEIKPTAILEVKTF